MGQMVRDGRVLMRADGPYGQPYGYNWRQHEVMVILAGGIGQPQSPRFFANATSVRCPTGWQSMENVVTFCLPHVCHHRCWAPIRITKFQTHRLQSFSTLDSQDQQISGQAPYVLGKFAGSVFLKQLLRQLPI